MRPVSPPGSAASSSSRISWPAAKVERPVGSPDGNQKVIKTGQERRTRGPLSLTHSTRSLVQSKITPRPTARQGEVMATFTRSDDLQGAEFVDADLRGARFVR